MNGQLIVVLVFAVISGALLLRLWFVLGRRTGTERRRDAYWEQTPRPSIFSRAPRPPTPPSNPPIIEGTAQPVSSSHAPGLDALMAADRRFDEQAFLNGARTAFQVIVNSFAAGDTAALKPLLSDDVYRSFAGTIAARNNAHEKLETQLQSIRSVEIASAAVEGTTALVTTVFVSEQISVLRGPDGAVREGDPDRVVEQTDTWTFARPTRSRDPNWTLVATHAP